MKLLIITQYFWPERFRINDLCLGLKERGHDISVLTGKPNYPAGKFYEGYSNFKPFKENWEGVNIYRSFLISRGNGNGIRLLVNYLSFALSASIRILFINGRFDRIFVYEPSPVTVGIPAILYKFLKKTPVYFWVQDLWPESLTAAGGINNRFILKIADSLTRFIYRNSSCILVQSKGFIPFIVDQGIDLSKIVYYPNSTENFYIKRDIKNEYLTMLPSGFRIMFAGNIGHGQSFDTLLKAAEILKNKVPDIKWVIIGNGRMKTYVEMKVTELGLENCFFLIGSYPAEQMSYFFACADALLVSLKRDNIFALTIPAKVQSYLACEKPIIGSIDGEGARVINEANAGLCAPAEDPERLAVCIQNMYSLSSKDRTSLGVNARLYFEKEFEREMLLDKLEAILNA